ncbi:unnamed protein product [Phaedon cochleariae]|uniref:Centrosome-associated protein 350-like n=1 Tax=Phaedon cochleariae TaxID=80249 RepID=A0A9P0DTW3_PHACE|nr:unnamed protein product [Phaedon cochleariae]
MAGKDDIGKRISETKRETEAMKAQLQSLINTGKNIIDSGFHSGISGLAHSHNDASDENVKTSPNKVQIVKSFNIDHSKHVNKITTSKKPLITKNEAQNDSPKKVRNYNRDEAREYIKKQREKRLGLAKIQETEKLKAELQKKKLQELHQKTKELVSKNVQAKRERSKSRDKNIYLRPDENPLRTERPRSLSRDKEVRKGAISKSKPAVSNINMEPRNPNLLHPPLPDYVQRQRNRHDERSRSKDNKEQEDKTQKISGKENNSPNKIINTATPTKEDHSSLKTLKPTNLFTNNDKDRALLDNEKTTKIQVLSNITIRSPTDVSKSQMLDNDQKKSANISDKNLRRPIILEKNTQETQTNGISKECPTWLQAQPAQGYPYNFINTVKRQLQFVQNSPKPSVDIRIQSLLVDSKSPLQNPEKVRTKPQSKEFTHDSASKKSNLNSFISHKCLNLDPRKIDHLELVPKGNYTSQNDIQSETRMSGTESESDTSKNIPEISSESGTSLKKNAESVRRNLNSELNLAINTDRLNDMKLVSHTIRSATTTIRSNINEIPTESDSVQNKSEPKHSELTPNMNRNKGSVRYSMSIDDDYESDFHTDLSRSRESIISSNSPTYNKQIILLSPEYVPSNHSKTRTERSKTNSSQSTTSISRELYSQNVPAAKSTPTEKLIIKEVPSLNVQNSITTEKHSTNIPNTIATRDNSETLNTSKFSTENEQKKSTKKSKSPLVFNSLLTEFHPSRTISENLSKSDSNLMFVNTKRGSSSSNKTFSAEPLKQPSISLITKEQSLVEEEKSRNMLIKNISLRSNKTETVGVMNSTNELHLKFEAEIHLLNDFNASLQQVAAVEKALETLKSNSKITTSKILQNQDTQTSARPKSSTASKISDPAVSEKSVSEVASINYSRGSFVNSVIEEDVSNILGGSILQNQNDTALSTLLDLSTLTQSKNTSVMKTSENEMNFENLQTNNFAGMSLNMFEQLIKDEDARLENLKAILKIREQVLLDRTKGELAWLEIQRKHFKETGQLHEASVIKKKQRGILVNHQKEKHEMQRMKQMQKAASVERKIVLKEQRNMIRQQLSTDNMLKKMKVNTPRERRQSGPLKVIQRHTESIRSETSVSKRSSKDQDRGQEVLSIKSQLSSVSRLSEISGTELSIKEIMSDADSTHQLSHVKRTLLMRETALKKRKKTAEDLLQWHEKLLEEEKRIAELESTASTIISQKPSASSLGEKYRFKGKQLNQLWYNLTGCESKKFLEEKIYPMSQMALERFCKNARDYSTKSTKLVDKTSDTEAKNSVEETEASSVKTESIRNEYPSDFDVESVLSNEEVEIVDQSISQLITNFSKIKEDISALGSKQSKKSDEDIDESLNFDKTDSEIEISVIETNKDTLEKNKSQETGSQLIPSINTEENSSKVFTNPEQNTKTEIATISPDKTSHIEEDSINIQNSVVENLNDSKEILLMLGHSEVQNGTSISEDILSKLNQVINDSEPKTSHIESHLSSSEKEELSREVRNSLSTTENILSKLSQVISEVQEKRSSEALTNLSTEEKKKEIGSDEEKKGTHSADISEEKSRRASLSAEEIETNAVESGSSKFISLVEKTEEDIIIVPEDFADIAEKISSKETHFSSEENEKEISTAKDSADTSTKISPKVTSIFSEENEKEIPTTQDSADTSEKISKVTSILSEEGEKKIPTTKDSAETSEEISNVSSISEENEKDIPTAKVSAETSDRVSSKHTNLSSKEEEKEASKVASLFSEDNERYVQIAEDSADISEEIASKHPSLSSKEKYDNTGEKTEEKRSSMVTSSLPEENETRIDTAKDSASVCLPSKKERDSTKICDISENQTISPDDEDLDETENTSSESLEQLLKISETAEVDRFEEKVSFIVDVSPNSSASQEKIEESVDKTSVEVEAAEKYSSDESLKETNIDEDLPVDTEPKTDQLSSVKDMEIHEGLRDTSPRSEEMQSSTEPDISETHLDLSYGFIDRAEKTVSNESEPHVSKEDVNIYEEKEQDSLSSSTTTTSSSDKLGQIDREDQDKSVASEKSSSSEEKSPKSGSVDVKKRVSEILADANQNSRGDKSPRMQDLYVTTYDLISPANSPEAGSPTNERKFINSIFGNEAEEILRKQLAIEQEIKAITEQQQKEQRIPQVYVREIPNKPPPPYTPPSSLPPVNYPTIVPTVQEIEEITKYSAKILHKAYVSRNLENISISENTLSLISKNVTKECYKFVFDLCKDISREHYKQFKEEKCPSWLVPNKKPQLTVIKPLDVNGLEALMNKKLKELFSYEKPNKRENTIIKWSRKKRDHVDEILVMESQAEEVQWTNYDQEELVVMDQVTNEIMNMLLKDTGEAMRACFEIG